MADSDLITRAAGGDPTAFQALVERHRSMVYRVAYQFAGNHFVGSPGTELEFAL